METKNALKLNQILTFFIIIMFLNYIFGSLFDIKIISYFNTNIKRYITDIEVLKLLSLLLYLLYVMTYSTIVVWILSRFFSIGKGFIYFHLNILLLFFLLISFLWINGFGIIYPGNFLKLIPFISVGILLFFGFLKQALLFNNESNTQNDNGITSSIKSDIEYSKQEIKSFFQTFKDAFKAEDNNYVDNINNDNKELLEQNTGQKDNKEESLKNNLDENNFDIDVKDIKGFLKENREKNDDLNINKPNDNIENIIKNPLSEIKKAEDDNNIDYIEINELEERDSNLEEESGNEEEQIIENKNYFENIFGDLDRSKYYVTGFTTDNDLLMLKDLIKKL